MMESEVYNGKNLLQEFAQKQKIPLPKYESRVIGGHEHRPIWISNVILHDGQKIQGESSKKKTEAEMSAAYNAYIYLKSNVKKIPSNIKLEGKTAVLVDIENMPKFIEETENVLHDFTIYAFIGEHHYLCEKNYPENVIKILSPSTRSDGTDTCMQVYTGMLLAKEEYDNYIIVTHDHYGAALVEMIQTSNLGWNKKYAKLLTKSSQF